jgi:hypothetical protein
MLDSLSHQPIQLPTGDWNHTPNTRVSGSAETSHESCSRTQQDRTHLNHLLHLTDERANHRSSMQAWSYMGSNKASRKKH